MLARADGKRRSSMVKYVKKILDPQGSFTNWISLMLCVISISMDSVFFYIPVIKVDKNCLDCDKKLGVISCVFRSVIDLFYIIYTRYQLRTDTSAPRPLLSENYNSPYSSHKGYINLLAVLPLPQVVVIIIFSKMSLSKILEALLNVLKYVVFLQFVPRVIRIYQLFKKATSTCMLSEDTWAKAAFSLYLYILSAHVFGALWYFFAIERKIDCWKKAYIVLNHSGSNHQSFNCNKSSGNFGFLNDVCSTKSHNTTFYDFGIYHDALQSSVVEGKFLQKFTYCFRWGLQSLSCFSQNLVTSINICEKIFTISITISSVVLFIFLLRNMKLYLQSETIRSEEMKPKVKEIEQWTTFKKLPKDLWRQGKKYERHVWRETKGVDVKKLLSNLPNDLRRNIKRELCLKLIKKVPIFRFWSDQPLNAMCERLKPVLYPRETYIVGKGDPVDEMLFIIHGELLRTSSNGRDRNSCDIRYLKDICGEELSKWVIDPESSSDQLPISTITIKTHTEVEAFALMADDLKDVFTQFRLRFPKCLLHSFRYESLGWRSWAACIIQVTWRCYRLKKLEECRHEDEKRVKNAPMREPTILPRKPADTDFTDEEK